MRDPRLPRLSHAHESPEEAAGARRAQGRRSRRAADRALLAAGLILAAFGALPGERGAVRAAPGPEEAPPVALSAVSPVPPAPAASPRALEAAEPRGDGSIVSDEPLELSGRARRWLQRRDPATLETFAQVEIRKIAYLSDGLEVRGYLAVPRVSQGEVPEPLPCVIYNRGGNRSFGALNDVRAVRLLGSLAAAGYVVVASQYRGNMGGQGREEFGGRDVDDVLNLIPLLDAHPRADASRIGMMGWSRGAMMTYLALAQTQRIAAAVVGAGQVDLAEGLRQREDMAGVYRDLIPGYAQDPAAALDARSMVRWPERLPSETPILILQGASDDRVDPGQALVAASALRAAGRPFRLVLFESGDHGLTEHQGEVDDLVRAWLARYVRAAEPWVAARPAEARAGS